MLAGIGGLAVFATARVTGGLRRRARAEPEGPLSSRVAAACGLLMVDLAMPLALLAALNLGALALPEGRADTDMIVATLSHAGLWILGVVIVVDLLWAPRHPRSALFRPEPRRAQAVGRILVGVTVATMALVVLGRLLVIEGMVPLAAALFALLLSIALLLFLLIGMWRLRSRVAATVRGAMPPGSAIGRLASLWPVPVSLYLLVIWFSTLGNLLSGGTASGGRLILSIVVPFVIFGIAAAVSRQSVARFRALGAHAPPTLDEHGVAVDNRGLEVAAARLSVAVWLVAILMTVGLLTWLYELKLGTLLGLDPALFRAFLKVICIALGAYVLYALITASIERRMLRLDEGQNPSRAKRLRTLLPLLRMFLMQVVFVMAVLIGLSSMGIDIGPLIAGAGIFGLAIGLGMQKLVTDIVSGVFFLMDDAFAVGDYIEAGGLRGRVEALSIRSMKLRHHRGPIHTLPYGEINSLTNHSRDWVIVKLEFRLPSDTDLARVKKIVKQIGQEISDDPELAKALLEPVKSQGVRRFEDNAMIVGVKFKALPGEQFVIRRQVYQKIRDAFIAADIHFADRGVVVRVDSEQGEAATAAAAAAASTVRDQVEKAGS